jgi:CheY-like chemotaxis protein
MSVLFGKHVLIVEDDNKLAEKISQLFRELTKNEPVVVHCIEDAKGEIAKSGNRFDLAVVDIMLPQSREDFRDIQKHEKKLADARATVDRIGEEPNDSEQRELLEARLQRQEALRRIFDLIDREGGISLIRECRDSQSECPFNAAVLYLTAVGNEPARQRGAEAADNRCEWLVKPVPSELIVRKSIALLSSDLSSQKGGR